MANYTQNLGLILPDYNEDADISVFNENMRLIDAKLALATASVPGLVMPDNETIAIQDGVLQVIAGGGGSGPIASDDEISDIIDENSESEGGSSTPDISTIADATAYTKGIVRPDNTTIFVENGVLSVRQYSLPVASNNTLGGIKVGNNLSIDENGVLSAQDTIYTLPMASLNTLGGIKIDNESLTIDEFGTVSVNFTRLALPIADYDTLGIVRIGDGLLIDSEGNLSVDFPDGFNLNPATYSQLGGVKPDGQTILIDNEGVIKIPFASTESYGIMKPDGVSVFVDENGIVSTVQSLYTLPVASDEILGGVKIDNSTITIDENNIIHAISNYNLPIATSSTLGGIIPDNITLRVNEQGVLSTTFSDFSTVVASETTLGGVKIDNDTITINSEGQISAHTRVASASVLGSVRVDNQTIQADSMGTLSVKTAYVLPTANDTVLGGVKVDCRNQTDYSPIFMTENEILALNILESEESGLTLFEDEDFGWSLTHSSGPGVLQAAGYQIGRSVRLGDNIAFPYITFDKHGHETSVSHNNLALPALSASFRQELEEDTLYHIYLNSATSTRLGGIIASENSFTISNSGVLEIKEAEDQDIYDMMGTTIINPDGSIGTMPIATRDVIGGVKVGENLHISSDGTLSVKGDMVTVDSVYESGIELGSITINGETVTFYIPDYEYADGMEY